MGVGISTACMYPELCENAVRYLCENGVSELEIFFNSSCEIRGDIFSEILHVVRANGTKVISVHPFTSGFEPFMIFSDYERRFLDGAEFYKKFFEACNEIGAKILVFHGDRAESKNNNQRYFERYGRLFSIAKEHGVILAQENVSRCRSRSSEFITEMKKTLGSEVKFVLDLKQANRSGENYENFVLAMGDALIHTHINDIDAGNDCLLPGDGERDFSEIKKKIESAGFCGEVMIEVYRENYGERRELLESYNKMKKVFE